MRVTTPTKDMIKLVSHHALGAVGGLIIVLAIARLASVEALGRFLVAQSLTFLVSTVVTSFLGKGVVLALKDASDRRAAGSRFIQLYAGGGILVSSLLLAFARWGGDPFHDRALMTLLAVMAAHPGLEILIQGFRSYLFADQRYGPIPRATFLRWTIHLPLSIGLLFAWRSELGVGLALVVSAAVECLFLAWVCRLPVRSTYRIPANLFSDLVAPAFLTSAATQLLKNLDLLLVKAMILSGAAAGLYGAAKSFGNLALLLGYALGTVVMVEVRGRTGEGQKGTLELADWGYRVLFVAGLGVPFFSLFGDTILATLLGPEYSGAASLLGPVFLGSLLLGAVALNAGIAMGLNLMWPQALVLVPFPILAGLAYWAAIPNRGLNGAMGTFLITSFAAAVGSFALLHRRAGVRLPVKTAVVVGVVAWISLVLGKHLPDTGAAPWAGMVAFGIFALFTLHASGELVRLIEAPEEKRAKPDQRSGPSNPGIVN